MANITPLAIAPAKMNGRRRPHRVFVLSVMNPIIGSVMASKNLGRAPSKPASRGSIPKATIRNAEKTPSAAGNKFKVNVPDPYAIFWPNGTISLVFIICPDIKFVLILLTQCNSVQNNRDIINTDCDKWVVFKD